MRGAARVIGRATRGAAAARVVGLALAGALGVLGGCGSRDAQVRVDEPPRPALVAPRLPRAPGEHGPSLVAIDRSTPRQAGEVSDGTMLSDVDSCATCHADAAAQWSTSAHSFASFGNPIYRVNVELMRTELGKHGEPALRRLSRHAADGRRADDLGRADPRRPTCARTRA